MEPLTETPRAIGSAPTSTGLEGEVGVPRTRAMCARRVCIQPTAPLRSSQHSDAASPSPARFTAGHGHHQGVEDSTLDVLRPPLDSAAAVAKRPDLSPAGAHPGQAKPHTLPTGPSHTGPRLRRRAAVSRGASVTPSLATPRAPWLAANEAPSRQKGCGRLTRRPKFSRGLEWRAGEDAVKCHGQLLSRRRW